MEVVSSTAQTYAAPCVSMIFVVIHPSASSETKSIIITSLSEDNSQKSVRFHKLSSTQS